MQTEIRRDEDGLVSSIRFVADNDEDREDLTELDKGIKDHTMQLVRGPVPEPSVSDPIVSPSAATGETSVGSASQPATEGG